MRKTKARKAQLKSEKGRGDGRCRISGGNWSGALRSTEVHGMGCPVTDQG